MIELPPYRLPGLRTALLHTFDRAKIFVKQAGTIILAISLVLWALSYYPKSAPPAAAVAMTAQAAQLEKSGDTQTGGRASRDRRPADRANLAAKFLCRQNRPRHRTGHRSRSVSTGRSASASSARLPRAKSSSPRWPSFMAWARTRRNNNRTSLYDSLRQADAHGRHADFQHGDVREPAGVLHPGRAMPFHHGRRAARDEQLEMAAVPDRLHDRPGLRRRADRLPHFLNCGCSREST